VSIDLTARPQLVRWARVRLDPKTGAHVLLYPEKCLVLNETSAEILRLCTGRRTVCDIVARLASAHAGASLSVIRRGARGFLNELARRGLLRAAS
jgi:pyrroloquinoline quinone biosynthesis protein D